MAYRSYQDVIRLIQSEGIEFTGKARKSYRKTPSAFASRARHWSQDRLDHEVRQLLRQQTLRENYRVYREDLNLSSKKARRLQHKSPDKFTPSLPYTESTRSSRYKMWAEWSELQNHPQDIIDLATMINKRINADVNASYGYAVVYYHYVEGADIDDVIEWLVVDVMEPDVYVANLVELGLV